MNNDLFIRVVLMLAIITFVKQLPKQIGDITGIKSEGMKMGLGGLKERFATGGGFAAGSIGGAGLKGFSKGLLSTGNPFKAVGKSMSSMTNTALNGGLKANDFASMSESRRKGLAKTEKSAAERQDRRVKYKAAGKKTYIGGLLSDKASDFAVEMGMSRSEDDIKREQDARKTLKGVLDDEKDLALDTIAKGKFSNADAARIWQRGSASDATVRSNFTNNVQFDSFMTQMNSQGFQSALASKYTAMNNGNTVDAQNFHKFLSDMNSKKAKFDKDSAAAALDVIRTGADQKYATATAKVQMYDKNATATIQSNHKAFGINFADVAKVGKDTPGNEFAMVDEKGNATARQVNSFNDINDIAERKTASDEMILNDIALQKRFNTDK